MIQNGRLSQPSFLWMPWIFVFLQWGIQEQIHNVQTRRSAGKIATSHDIRTLDTGNSEVDCDYDRIRGVGKGSTMAGVVPLYVT